MSAINVSENAALSIIENAVLLSRIRKEKKESQMRSLGSAGTTAQTASQAQYIDELAEKIQEKYAVQDEILSRLLKEPALENPGYDNALWEGAKIDFKYKYYIEKQDRRVEKLRRLENLHIPMDFDYGSIPSLSAESRNKLEKIRPLTLGQAERISGIRNSDIMLLMVYLK